MPPSNPKFRPYQSRAVVVDPYRGSRQEQGHGQLANTKSWGPGGERPDTIRVLVCWGDKWRELEIPEEQFFGRYGSPLAGEGLISMIGNLVRQGPPAEDK